MSTEYSAMAYPKKSWLNPPSSGRPECTESQLQSYCNELLELKHIRFIRFPDDLLRWIKLKSPSWFSKAFFHVWGGRADNIIFFPLGNGYHLSVNLELKTADKKGRAVGRLHGKQIRNAEAEGWQIARSPEDISAVIARAEAMVVRIKKAIAEGENRG